MKKNEANYNNFLLLGCWMQVSYMWTHTYKQTNMHILQTYAYITYIKQTYAYITFLCN